MGSCSSSLNSLEFNELTTHDKTNSYNNNDNQINQQYEFVTSLTFINSYSKKGSKNFIYLRRHMLNNKNIYKIKILKV